LENRAFQLEARRQLNTLLNNSRHPVYLAPCGTGKTYTAAALIKDRLTLNRRVYVLVPQVEIFDEWMKVLSEAGLNPGYINDEGIRGRDRGVYVCMTLSLINLLPHIPESLYPDEIITDEMQHSLAASWETVYRHFDKAQRIGLTATLYHGSLRSFEHLYTDVVQTINKSGAIAQGYITLPLLMVPAQWAANVPKNGDDYDAEIQAKILGKPAIVGDVIDFYERTFAGKPVIVPCSTYLHAEQMTEAFNAKGWRFEHLHSGLAAGERKRILRSVAAGRSNGICTVGIGIEGMSIHGLYGVLWLRRTASPIIWTQFNGRAERVLDGKRYYICADFVGNSVIHGMPDRDLFWKLKQENAELPEESQGFSDLIRICPWCGVANSELNTECHFCGGRLDATAAEVNDNTRIPAYIDGELVPVESSAGASELLAQHIAEIKEAQADERARAAAPRVLSDGEKIGILRKNLFGGNRRKLFSDAVKDWL
jgi:superfamily II DNA or RNA helicase